MCVNAKLASCRNIVRQYIDTRKNVCVNEGYIVTETNMSYGTCLLSYVPKDKIKYFKLNIPKFFKTLQSMFVNQSFPTVGFSCSQSSVMGQILVAFQS